MKANGARMDEMAEEVHVLARRIDEMGSRMDEMGSRMDEMGGRLDGMAGILDQTLDAIKTLAFGSADVRQELRDLKARVIRLEQAS